MDLQALLDQLVNDTVFHITAVNNVKQNLKSESIYQK